MNTTDTGLQAFPRVLSCGISHKVRIECPAPPPDDVKLLLTPCDEYVNSRANSAGEDINGFTVYHSLNSPREMPYTHEGGDLYFTLCPTHEGEWTVHLLCGGVIVGAARLYSVAGDLAGLYPYKGDFHMHSRLSDGRQEPEDLPASVRAHGLDFMALADHGKKQGSFALARRVEELGLENFRAYPAEEVHLPGHQMHILNLGEAASVNEIFTQHPARFEKECAALASTLETPPGVDEESYVMAIWALRKIREGVGFSVFCHPFWRRANGFALGLPFTMAMLAAGEFDAMELISGYGGFELESNLLQVALYGDLLRSGDAPPIVGTSDAHDTAPGGAEGFLGSYYTMVLAPSLDFGDVAAAILGGRSVAAMGLPGAPLHLYGPLRMVKYCYFLAREVMPARDGPAKRQAGLLAAWQKDGLRDIDREITGLYKKLFAF